MLVDIICKISYIIAAIGAINWATTSLGFNFVNKSLGHPDYKDFYQSIFSPKTKESTFFKYGRFEKSTYILIGAAGIISLFCVLFFNCRTKKSNL